MKTYIIVGTRFESFATHATVMPLATLETLLTDGDARKLADSVFELGQGIGAASIERILCHAERLGIRDNFLFDRVLMCGVREVHKHHAANAIISIPVQVSPDTFESLVLIDDDSELLSDHMTGQHLPGMVFVEAVRQLCLGVTETHFPQDAQKSAFLLTSINVRFINWAFPLVIKAAYRIVAREQKATDASDFDIEVTFTQGDKVVASGTATFELRNRRVVSRHEHLLARTALATASNLLFTGSHTHADSRVAVG